MEFTGIICLCIFIACLICNVIGAQGRTMTIVLIGVAGVLLLLVTHGCSWYIRKYRKQHRQQPQINSVNAEPVAVQYGPYDEIDLTRDEYLEVTDSISIPDRNSLHDSVGNSPQDECVINNPQDSPSSSEASYDYAVPQDEGAGYLNPYNSLQSDPQSRCQNYTALRRSSTTRIKSVYSKETFDDDN